MITNQPTTAIFFVFAFTYCKISVYEAEAAFARKLLEAAGVEVVKENSREDYQEVDTRLLFTLVKQAFPKMLEDTLPNKEELVRKASITFCIKPS